MSKLTICFMLFIFSGGYCYDPTEDERIFENEMKSLKQAIDVATGKEFEEIFDENGNNASQLLYLFQAQTKIENDYLEKVFIEAAKVKDLKDLDSIHLDVHQALDLANEVIHHFQKEPMAGWPKDEL